MSESAELRHVRFKVYHGGMGADVGEVLHVPADWAEQAIAAGIVEPAEAPLSRQMQGFDSPGWVGGRGGE